MFVLLDVAMVEAIVKQTYLRRCELGGTITGHRSVGKEKKKDNES